MVYYVGQVGRRGVETYGKDRQGKGIGSGDLTGGVKLRFEMKCIGITKTDDSRKDSTIATAFHPFPPLP
jgi:hypothetical protein